MKKKRQQTKRRTTSNRSTKIMTKNFEIFVTDFLLDPCGLPLELKDCVLIDGSMPISENGDICPTNNSQVLKKIYTNSLVLEESCKK